MEPVPPPDTPAHHACPACGFLTMYLVHDCPFPMARDKHSNQRAFQPLDSSESGAGHRLLCVSSMMGGPRGQGRGSSHTSPPLPSMCPQGPWVTLSPLLVLVTFLIIHICYFCISSVSVLAVIANFAWLL